MYSICLITAYFGKWPDCIYHFFKSCEHNPTINWLIFSDCPIPQHVPANVTIVPYTLELFNQLASAKLGIAIHVSTAYKLTDFKPAFGAIFEDYIVGFDFWGYGDLDVIYGNIRYFLSEDILRTYEIISASEFMMYGPFSLFKNRMNLNNIFRQATCYEEVFQSSDYYNFDECFYFLNARDYTPDRLEVCKKYNLTYIIKHLSAMHHLSSLFTQLAHNHKRYEFLSSFKYDNGTLVDLHCKREVMLYHLFTLKDAKYYFIDTNHPSNVFYVTDYGIYPDLKIDLRRLCRMFFAILDDFANKFVSLLYRVDTKLANQIKMKWRKVILKRKK